MAAVRYFTPLMSIADTSERITRAGMSRVVAEPRIRNSIELSGASLDGDSMRTPLLDRFTTLASIPHRV